MLVKDLLTYFRGIEKTKRELLKEISDGEKLIVDLGKKYNNLNNGTISKADCIAAIKSNIEKRRAIIIKKIADNFAFNASRDDCSEARQSCYDACFSEEGNDTWFGLFSLFPCLNMREREETMLLYHADAMLSVATEIINSIPDKDWPKVTNASAEIAKADIETSLSIIESTRSRIEDIKQQAKKVGVYLTPRTAADDIDYEVRG
ncbi:hypothetical protein LZ92_19275 [Salmonella enterica]|nr:hypothetical protein [Salmonella enterica subsp. enterica serovar Newport]EBP1502408.1 hypothetical protein [Salmonella enterica]